MKLCRRVLRFWRQRAAAVPLSGAGTQRAAAAGSGKKAEVLGKWLWILFWLMIVVQPVVGLMSDETVVGWFPQLYWPGQIASLLFLLADGAIFLKISEVELSYRTAGICQIVAGVVNFVVQLFTDRAWKAAGCCWSCCQ